MTEKIADYVLELVPAPGVSGFVTGTPVSGRRSFAQAVSEGILVSPAQIYYFADDTVQQEWGIGTYTTGSGVSRDTVLWTSAGSTAKLNFATLPVYLYPEIPASRMAYRDSSGNLRGAYAAVLTGTPPTLASGEGAHGGSATNGGVFSGKGSTNDVTIQNGAGAAALTLATGTLNWTAPGTLTINSSTSGANLLTLGNVNLGMTTATARCVSASANYFGTSTDTLVAFNRINASGDTVDASTAGGANLLYVGHTLGGSTLKGNRNAIEAFMSVKAPTGNSTGTGRYYVPLAGVSVSGVSDNGTAANAVGKLFGANLQVTLTGASYSGYISGTALTITSAIVGTVAIGQGVRGAGVTTDTIITAGSGAAWTVSISQTVGSVGTPVSLTSGATNWFQLQGLEIDFTIQAGAGAQYGGGLSIVQSSGAVSVPVNNAAIFIANVQGVTAAWDMGVSFGFPTGQWPFASTSTIIGTQSTAFGGAYAAAYGIDFSAVTFGTAFLKSNGFLVDGSGNVVGVSIGNGATALQVAGAGSWSANGAVATALSSVGPTGAHTTVQEWLTFKNASGTVRYIPAF